MVQSVSVNTRTVASRVFMGVEFKLASVLLVASIAVVNISVQAQLSVEESFESYDIVPDVISSAPKCEAIVNYPGGVRVHLGKELTPTQVKDIPTVDYDASPDDFYTLVFVDPDVPSRDDPVLRELEHWLVVNIPGNNVNSGETIAEYIGSAPQNGTGLHRYVFLIYQQQGLLTFDEPHINKTSGYTRAQFSTARFAEKYNLGDPVAGNFYQAQYDDYVPILRKQLGI